MFMRCYVYQVITVWLGLVLVLLLGLGLLLRLGLGLGLRLRLRLGVSYVAVSGILIGARPISESNNIDEDITFIILLCS